MVMPQITSAAWLLLMMVCGVLLEKITPLTSFSWFSCSAIFLCLWHLTKRSPVISQLTLLLSLITASGLIAHSRAHTTPSNSIRSYVHDQGQIVHLEGVIESPPTLKIRQTLLPGQSQESYSTFTVRTSRLLSQTQSESISGRLIVTIDGDQSLLSPGDRVRVWGLLRQPAAPLNPHEFDYAYWLDLHHLDGTLRVDHPDALTVIQSTPSTQFSSLWELRQSMQLALRTRLQQILPSDVSALAIALLLGNRDQLSPDLIDAFKNTGLIHLISISGLHLAMIIGLFAFLLRAFPMHNLLRLACLLILILGYLTLIELRPPVMRAGFLALGWISGSVLFRRPPLDHLLIISTIILLLIDPASLEDVGAQLSFLSLYAISLAERVYQFHLLQRPPLIPTTLINSWQHLVQTFWEKQQFAILWIPASILLITSPYLIAIFGRFSVVSLLLTWPISLLLLTPVLFFGIVTLVSSLLPLLISSWLAMPFVLFLRLFSASVSLLEYLPATVNQLPDPTLSWIVIYYIIAFCPLILHSNHRRFTAMHRTCLTLMLAWITLGLSWPLWQYHLLPHSLTIRCHAVGHGNATIVQFPNRQAILVDAGSFYGSPYSVVSLQRNLHAMGIHRLAAVIISHTDSDHYNLLGHLSRLIPIDQVLLSPASFREESTSLNSICEQIIQNKGKIRFIQQGDTLHLDDRAQIEILHPHADPQTWSQHDNANSIVLRISFAQKSLLLTGDIERDGLDALMKSTTLAPQDVLLMPHHGAQGSNPPSMGKWTNPKVAIASSSQRMDNMTYLSTVYPSARRRSTAEGAIEIVWTKHNQTLKQYQQGAWGNTEAID